MRGRSGRQWMHIGRWKFFSPSPHNPRLDLFHGFAQGGVAKVALGDLVETGARPAGLEERKVFEGGDAVVEAAGEQDG